MLNVAGEPAEGREGHRCPIAQIVSITGTGLLRVRREPRNAQPLPASLQIAAMICEHYCRGRV